MTTITTEHGFKIEFNEQKHVYIHDNQYVVGMSTILGHLASPKLEGWKLNNEIKYIKKEMERQGISIEKIALISGVYIVGSLVLLLVFRNKLQPVKL